MQPINFAMDVRDPFESALQGFQTGAGIRAVMDKQEEAERARIAQEQMQADLGMLASNPNATAADYSSMMVKYPQLSEHFKRSWDVLDGAQRQAKLGQATQVYAALQSNRPDVAASLLKEQAAAKRNSGLEDEAKLDDALAQSIEMDPGSAKATAALLLSSVMGPDKFAETFTKLGSEQRAQDQAPADLRKANADATAAEVKAKYAESEALLDLEKAGWDIKKAQNEINVSRENSRIAAMNAALNRESNDLKRQELQMRLDDAVRERDAKIREKAAEVETARTSMDNMLNTVDRILANPSLDDVLGSMEGRLPAAISSGLDDEESNAIALIENLKSQTFLAQIPAIKGTGALSNAEGDKLQSALQNLERAQGEKQFRANLAEAQRLILKARKNLATRYGVPDNIPDRPAAQVQGMPPGFRILGKE